MQEIRFRELKDLEIIGDGGFGVVYKAKHARLGTVVYKELDVKKLGDRYIKVISVQYECITKLAHIPCLGFVCTPSLRLGVGLANCGIHSESSNMYCLHSMQFSLASGASVVFKNALFMLKCIHGITFVQTSKSHLQELCIATNNIALYRSSAFH